jgi:hypothetical protein
MEKAEERKKIINLEPKMTGIMSSNPFSVLPIDELDTMANQFGVNINETVDENINESVDVSNVP